jgi:ATP-dependent DNA ligase
MPLPDTRPRDGYIPPCIPTRAVKPPAGHGWVHEIKHDGYRLQVRREGDSVRLFTRRGFDWTRRYPAIAVTATLLRAKSFTLDGEAVVCGPDGVAVFDAPPPRHRQRGHALRADSDEVARAFRDDVARCSDMMPPGVRCLAG